MNFEPCNAPAFNPCNSQFPQLLKNNFVCDKTGVQQCFSSTQNKIDFCRCKSNYKQCEDGGNECSVRCKHLKEDCPEGFKWNRMGTGCECVNPYFINKRNNGIITSHKLFSDKHCKSNGKREEKICYSFCGKKKTKSCSIKIHLSNNLYRNSTNEDVTCKCRKFFEVSPKTGRCRKNKKEINNECRKKCKTVMGNECDVTKNSDKKYFLKCTRVSTELSISCGIAEDFTWTSYRSIGCRCPFIAGTDVPATWGKKCVQKNQSGIKKLCKGSVLIQNYRYFSVMHPPTPRQSFFSHPTSFIKTSSTVLG